MQFTIELLNDNALSLIYDLERLNIIRLIKREDVQKTEIPEPFAPRKRFAGRISKETAADLQQQLKQSREEWQL